jgi:hypothetical protein
MSDLPQKRLERCVSAIRREGPYVDSCSAAKQHFYSITSSPQAHDIGHVEAERLGGFEVEDELELGRLLPSAAKDLGTNGRAISSACLACI